MKIIYILAFSFLVNTINCAQKSSQPNDSAQEFMIVDSHIHNGFSFANNKVVLSNFEYFSQRQVNSFLFPLPVDRSKTENLYLRIKDEIEQLRLLSNETGMFSVINTAGSINENIMTNKTNVILSIEYFDGIFNGNPGNVDNYYNLGVRYITIIDNEVERLFEVNNLTPFGKELINKMNETKMLIDISHLSDDRKITVINYSNSHVIVSHSNTRKIADLSYNLSDKVLAALSQKKGYVFVSFNENGLYKRNNRDINAIDQFINHIDYLIKFLGYDYVGIGSDYQANGKYVPQQLNEITTYNNIKDKLFERGLSTENVKKIMGNNILKALSY